MASETVIPEVVGIFNFAKAFSTHRSYLSDVCDVDYTCGESFGNGFESPTDVFNDGVTVCMSSTKDLHKADSNYVKTAICDVMGSGVKILRADNGCSSDIRFCITSCESERIPQVTVRKIDALLKKYKTIKLLDIDFTLDCGRISTRKDVIDWLPSGTKIADSKNRTGNNCISWFEDDGKQRCKEYNKTVQIAETAGARPIIGSDMHLMLNGSALSDSIISFKDVGMTRLEITFYGSELKPADEYVAAVLDLFERMKTCKTYSVSLEQQWSALSSCLTQMLCIYHEPSSMFAYVHWWNSLTGKMQGSQKEINRKNLLKVVANFGFSERPVYLLTVGDDDGEELKVYRRAIGSSDVTLLPGPSGLYAQTNKMRYVLSDFGIGSVAPGYLGWVDKLRSESSAIATVVEENESSIIDDELAMQMASLTVNTREYKKGSEILEVGKTYKIVAVGREIHYGKPHLFFRTKDGIAVRCEKSLRKIIEDRETNGEVGAFSILVRKKTNGSNISDIECDIVD